MTRAGEVGERGAGASPSPAEPYLRADQVAFHKRYGWGGPLETWEIHSIYACSECGAVVRDTGTHDRWHDQ